MKTTNHKTEGGVAVGSSAVLGDSKPIDIAARDAAKRCFVLSRQDRPNDVITGQMAMAIADEMRWLSNAPSEEPCHRCSGHRVTIAKLQAKIIQLESSKFMAECDAGKRAWTNQRTTNEN
jgi:hypothetical protein